MLNVLFVLPTYKASTGNHFIGLISYSSEAATKQFFVKIVNWIHILSIKDNCAYN